MKNNFLIFLFIFILISKTVFANQFIFETTEIEFADNGDYIYATDGKAFSADKNLEINAKSFEYSKNLKLLKAANGVAFIKSDNLKIEFNKIELDELNSMVIAKDDVKIYDEKNKIFIESDLIIYNRNSGIIESPLKSIFKDKFQNIITTEKFHYNINANLLKIENAILEDSQDNDFEIELAYIDTELNELVGKDVIINLNNESFEPDNEPRLKGNSIVYDDNFTQVDRGVFTTCKKTGKCPPWKLTAEKITHDKKKKVISYKNAWLNVYDVPVIYFPKFFHPDPTVKRRSGFLIPSFQSTKGGSSLNIPYFHVVSDNKDFTLSPRLYTGEKILLQTEYRQVNLNSTQISDFSFFKEADKNSKNHFFYELNKSIDYLNFEDGDIDFQIQKTSNDTYLKANKLRSPILDDYVEGHKEFLESSFDLDLYSDDFSVRSGFIIYEDVNKDHSDRYEFVLPRVDITKKIENKTKLDGDFLLKSYNSARNYQTNIFEKTNINDLIFNSKPNITDNGFYNNYNFKIKNVNSDSQKSLNYKDNKNYYLSGIVQFNSSLPLLKENDKFRKILKPKLSLKMSPEHSKNTRNSDIRLDASSIYNLDRVSSIDSIEGGTSLIYGNDFTVYDKKNSREILEIKLANNLRFEENEDLPTANQIGEKTSNFLGEITYSPNSTLTTKYNSSLRSNFSDVTYENFITEININNFVTTFDYLNENNHVDKNSYLSNETEYSFNESNSVMFSTRQNKKTDLTEYYNLMYQYKNDCLSASIEYNKDYYDDRDIKPEETIFFKLTIIPLGETKTIVPGLRD